MLPSAESLHAWLARVDREALRLGTREYLIAARIRDEAAAQGQSLATLGDALASALATDRDTWRELRRLFDVQFSPPPAPPPSRWPRLLAGGLLLTVLVATLFLGLCRSCPGPEPDLGIPDLPATEAVDLGAADLKPPATDLGCHKDPVPQPDGGATTRTSDEPVPLLPLSLGDRVLWALALLLLGALAMVLLRLSSYLRRRLAEHIKQEQVEAQRRKQKEEEQEAEGDEKRRQQVRAALASGQPTRPLYRVELQPPFGPDVVEDSATLLGRAYLPQSGSELDIEGTLHATIERGGAAKPVFLPRREVRELCVLYDDTTTRPYLPGFLKLVERWARLGVRLSLYRFSRHPATLTPISVTSAVAGGPSQGPDVELAELLRQREGCSLLLFANRLVVRTLKRDLDWVRTLRQAPVCAWLDPDPRLDAERDDDTRTDLELLPRHLPRYPLTADGLLAAARYIGSPQEGARPPAWSPLPALSDPHLGLWIDLWLAVGALVPDAAYNQLEAVRQNQKLLGEALPDPRSIGRLVERLTQLLGPSYSAGKATIELSKPLRFRLLGKLLLHDRALFRRACALFLESLSEAPKLQPGEAPSLLHDETAGRRAWYQAGIALCDGQPTEGILEARLGTGCHQFIHESIELLTQLGTQLVDGPSSEPVLEVVTRPPVLTWPIARIPTLLWQSALVAALFPLLFVTGLRTLKTWPRRTVAVTTTYQRAQQTQPDEQVICPNRPKVAEPEPEVVAVKPPPVVEVKKPAAVPIRRLPPPPKPSPVFDMAVGVPVELATATPPDLATPPPAPTSVALRPPMVPIRSGRFQMGSPAGSGDSDERPQREVHIQTPFLMSATEVTQAQYQAVMGENPSYFKDGGDASNRPVERVSWLDAVRYCNKLSAREKLESCYEITGDRVEWPKRQGCTGYRLPTEAEWEYAARAGEAWEYAGSNKLDEVAWYSGNSGGQTHAVGTTAKKTNLWGLSDMSGNVWEWVWDWYKDSYAGASSVDPTGPSDGGSGVVRGGSYVSGAFDARVAYRFRDTPSLRLRNIGFRLARSNP